MSADSGGQPPRVHMTTLSGKRAAFLAAGIGVILWVAAAVVGGQREAWDSSIYWTAAYPVAIAASGLLGYLAPARPWRWGLTIMLAQAVTMAVASSSFGLLPLGLMLFAALAVPAMAVAQLGARLRLRSGPVS